MCQCEQCGGEDISTCSNQELAYIGEICKQCFDCGHYWVEEIEIYDDFISSF